MAPLIETERLELRYAHMNDREFIFRLLNDQSWIENIGDKNIETLLDAELYIHNTLLNSYAKYSFGLFVVEIKRSQMPIGLCGLIRRDSLPHIDLGYAFLPEYWGQGFAFESAEATLNYGHKVHSLDHVVAITLPGNIACIRLLGKLGFSREREICLPEDTDSLDLYSIQLQNK